MTVKTASVNIVKTTSAEALRYEIMGNPASIVYMDKPGGVPTLKSGPYNVKFSCGTKEFAVVHIEPNGQMVRFDDKGEPTSLPKNTDKEFRSQMDQLGWALLTIAKTDPTIQDFIKVKQFREIPLE